MSAPTEGQVSLDMPPALALQGASNWQQRVSRYAPVPDYLAAVTAALGFRLPPRAAMWVDAASGVLWSGSAGMSELGNMQPRSLPATANNVLNAGAGLVSAVAPFTSGATQAALDYAGSVVWELSAFATIGRAAFDTSNSRVRRGLAAASGAANVAAAAFAAAATRASQDNDSATAIRYGTVSSGLWIAGTTLSLVADCMASRTAFDETSTTATYQPAQRYAFNETP
ncbi:hypothetical protein [Trinickia sp. EG282A]|uniref:hypothetical protein n=1 Tax=Trinickia sp. EG282A TaxID=3237013 RepID=UPI0034D25A73